MTTIDFSRVILYLLVLFVLAWPLGLYMARIYEGRSVFWDRVGRPLERLVYWFCEIRPDDEMDWKGYALAAVSLNVVGMLAVYALQRLQGVLPLNPLGLGGVSPGVALNTAISFASNTNWQAYGGESTMSFATQMLALTVQNFLSAATGMAVLAALIRGLSRRETRHLGNFWVDCTRSVTHILLPLSVLLAVLLMAQGVPQTFQGSVTARLLDPVTYDKPVVDGNGAPRLDAAGKPMTESAVAAEQKIALGPVASQEAVKQLGTNGGGFFNANSSHPFENPTPLSNFLEVLAILLIPAALCITFGRMVRDTRQGVAVLATMTILFALFLFPCLAAERAGNPRLAALGVDASTVDAPLAAAKPGGNMEGKEMRFGVVDSALWATATTAASNGSVNSMHDSFTPLGGLFPMLLMQLGEVVFGGVGSGLYGMLVFAIVAVFVAGLMVGRTPEYLGKKIEAFEMKMAALVILIPPFLVLCGAAVAVATGARTAISNPGAHGFSEILYAFSSMGNNNGSAFAGLAADRPYYAWAGAFAMFVARYWLIVPTLALAGSLAGKKSIPTGAGTLSTHTPLFVGLLVAVVLTVGALTFIPALALGPVVEHLMLPQ
ncbi:potassium-transporting ATPase subunit KdpA [Solidesulfovibrio sp.]|uniref:potassium-transporting ATPase subunit KdpA n=1 Tax=Solidesulfovibrio sp. TaxID=2910990 RepID=UPI002B20CC3F|nr:potassium-transporting ATPase subunit KdpA [Solidesulfovibrio sp.]MEA5090489.1 potassium-transporting ATPase subunit KdpA [Solidesulfovibrio sp.]